MQDSFPYVINEGHPHTADVIRASIDELKLALRLFNEPYHERGAEGSLVHLNQAWLYLVHAAMIELKQEIRNPIKDAKQYLPWKSSWFIALGKRKNKQTFLGGCASPFLNPDTNEVMVFSRFFKLPPVQDDDSDIRAKMLPAQINLSLFNSIRDHVEHRAVSSQDALMHLLTPYLLANVNNYVFSLEEVLLLLNDLDVARLGGNKVEYLNAVKSEIRFPLFYDILFQEPSAKQHHHEKSYLNRLKEVEPGIAEDIIAAQDYMRQWILRYGNLRENEFRRIPERALSQPVSTNIDLVVPQTNTIQSITLADFGYHSGMIRNRVQELTGFVLKGTDVRLIAETLGYRENSYETREVVITDNIHCLYVPQAGRVFYSEMFVNALRNLVDTGQIAQLLEHARYVRYKKPWREGNVRV